MGSIYHLYIANWVILWYLPPINGNQETPLKPWIFLGFFSVDSGCGESSWKTRFLRTKIAKRSFTIRCWHSSCATYQEFVQQLGLGIPQIVQLMTIWMHLVELDPMTSKNVRQSTWMSQEVSSWLANGL